MIKNKLTLAFAAVALAIPAAPAAAYSQVCLEMPLVDAARIWVDKLNTNEMRADALESAKNGVFSYGTPRAVETRNSGLAYHKKTVCLDVSDFLAEGDIFRVRTKSFGDVLGDPKTCRPNYRKRGESFWNWPEFYVQDGTDGVITFIYHHGGPFDFAWCQMKRGEGRWRGCYDDMNLVTPGCWKLGPKSTNGARVSQYIGDQYTPAKMTFLLMEGPALGGRDERLRNNETPLHRAVRLNNNVFTKNLLIFGANQTLADDRGRTPMHAAVEANRPDNLRWLIGRAIHDGIQDAALAAKDEQGRTPLHLAVHKTLTNDWSEILAMLLTNQGGHMNTADNSGEAPLHTATRKDRPALVLELLAAGVDPAAPHGKTGETALDLATRLGTIKSAAALITQGAPRLLTDENSNPADAIDDNGQTALHRAAAVGDSGAVLNLMRLGADPNIREKNGDTAMIFALKAGHQGPIRYLLTNNGANPNLAGRGGDTALHWAARVNLYQVVNALISEALADINPKNGRGETPLDVAALAGSVESAAILISGNAARAATDESVNPANGKNADGDAPLHLAVMANNPERIAKLLPLQPDINIRNHRGETPLLLALRLERAASRVVDPLLAAGADPTAGDNSGVSAMHRAAGLGALAPLQAGLAQGADVNAVDNNGAAALHWALRNQALARRNPAADFLLENGANPALPDGAGNAPLHDAALNGYPGIIDAAADYPGADLDVRNNQGATPLHLGISGGQEYSVRALLAAGADPTLRDRRFDFTALHWAASVGNAAAARAIKQHHPDIDLEMRGGSLDITPLMQAVIEGGRLIFVRAMLELGASPDIVGNGYSPLEWTAQNARHLDVAAALLEHGADPDFSASSDSSPAHVAARVGNVEMIGLLAARGADFSRAGANNQLPQDYALAQGHGGVIRALHEQGREFSPEFISRMRLDSQLGPLAAELFGAAYDQTLNQQDQPAGKTKLHYAAQYNNMAGVEDLLRRGASPHIRNKDGQTPMMTAIIRGHSGNERIVRVLLQAEADPNEGDDHNNTPLSWAAKSGQTETARVLLEFGAAPDQMLGGKFTPLHLAAKSSPQIVRMLVEAGTDVNTPDRRGYTPLHWALDPNNDNHDLVGEIVTELLNLKAEMSPDPTGKDLVQLAEEGQHHTAAALLRVRRAFQSQN